MKEKILSIFWIYYIISGVYIILLLFIFDAVSQVYPMLGIFGTITWYLSYLYIIIFALVSFFKIVKSASLLKTPFSLITIIFFITLIFIRLDNPKSLSAEASIEISCGINQLTTTPDFGYNQTCMFGYPARQYFLPALTTFLFGRNIVSINSGNAIYFILGLIIFSSGILELYSHSFKGDLINSILVEEGYAKVYDKYANDTKRYQQLKRIEDPAKTNMLGVWSCPETNTNCLFLGSKNSDKYYKPGCKTIKRIKPENLICYNSTAQVKKLTEGNSKLIFIIQPRKP
ncbi:MAG: hypothetical protein US53_C0035G0011 [Candidatus Woesebacteria bacterium GW2011_GWA1_37_7]|uniref:TNase-like domain-containing protein n=1 Tax=Candidatus Woesebacteria bacterium GW2011_GWA1_37_7 TaxID=1618545 RepID=A0A0G0H0V2_9BACT|nr:MAG: hypothetical protein US53_C0035G0011 [Candidatus Woesebacteria bacterium GW2011_GWA1_37_7]